jgi:hypothetical protein
MNAADGKPFAEPCVQRDGFLSKEDAKWQRPENNAEKQ